MSKECAILTRSNRNLSCLLQGLQELPYLSRLNVAHNYLEDLTSLSRCFRMRHLRLGNNNISSLEGLEGLHDLVVLELDHNQVSLGISLRQNSSGAVLRSL